MSPRRWYACALLLRVVLALLPLSVLHPDEWMQSAQPMAEQLTQTSAQQTWDSSFTCVDTMHLAHEGKVAATRTEVGFECPEGMQLQRPIRGVLASWFSCGLPYGIYRFAAGIPTSDIASFLLFLLPRLNQLFWSVVTDGCIFLAARAWYPSTSAWTILSQYSWSFAGLVMISRTFSNSTETTVLAATIALASLIGQSQRKSSSLLPICIAFGVLIGLGASIRLSILFFAWPIGMWLILSHMRRRGHASLLERIASFVHSGCIIAPLVFLPGVITFLLCVVVDSLFYETLAFCSSGNSCAMGVHGATSVLISSLLSGTIPTMRGSLLWTAWNNYLYNSDPSNVAHHGLHPRYLHLTVNMMILFGPVVYWRLMRRSYSTVQAIFKQWTPPTTIEDASTSTSNTGISTPESNVTNKDSTLRRRGVPRAVTVESFASTPSQNMDSTSCSTHVCPSDMLLLGVCWSGLLLLSCVPHQEFRFLLPCAIPIALLTRSHTAKDSSVDVPNGWTRIRKILSFTHTLATVILLGVLHQGGLIRQWIGREDHVALIYLHTYTTPSVFLHAALRQGDHQPKIHNLNDLSKLDLAAIVSHDPSSALFGTAKFHDIRLILPTSVPFPFDAMKALLLHTYPLASSDSLDDCSRQVCLLPMCHFISPHLSLDEQPNFASAQTHPPTPPLVKYKRGMMTTRETSPCPPEPNSLSHAFGLVEYTWLVPKR